MAGGARGGTLAGMVRVLTVDDHLPFLEVAHELMDAMAGFESAGEAPSAAEGMAAIERFDPDLVLVDVHMPDVDGIELTRRIISASPDPPVVVLISAQDPSQLPSAAEECGAAAVIRKQELAPARLRTLWRRHGHTT